MHVDGALGATSAPFLRLAAREGDGGPERVGPPKFDFELPEVCSIVTSGHKYIGTPWPWGILMTRRHLQLTPPGQPDAVALDESTLGGSRNALGPLALWTFLAQNPGPDQTAMALATTKLAEEAADTLAALGPQWDVHRSPWSSMVWFKKPNRDIVDEHFLLTTTHHTDDATQEYASLNLSSDVTTERIAQLAVRMSTTEPAPSTPPTRSGTNHGSDVTAIHHLASVPVNRRCV